MPNKAHLAFKVLVYQNYNKTAIVADISRIWTNLSFSTALHGGFKECLMSIPMSLDKASLWLNRNLPGFHFYHLEISEQSKIIWEGRIMNITMRKDPSFQGIDVEAVGYWASARDRYYSNAGTAWSDSGTLVRSIVTTSCPDLNGTANIGTTGLDITGFLTSTRDYPQNWIIDKIAPLSDGTGNIYYFAVWENRVPYFNTRIIPTTPDWYCYLEDIQFLQQRQQAEHLRNFIQPVIGTADGTSTSDADSIARYVRREIIFQVQTGVPAATANKGRDAMLTERKLPRQDLNFTLKGRAYSTQGIQGTAAAGAAMDKPLWWIRAGHTIRIQDLLPASQSTAVLDDLRTFYILETHYDAVQDSMSIQPDRNAQDLSTILGQLGTLEQTS